MGTPGRTSPRVRGLGGGPGWSGCVAGWGGGLDAEWGPDYEAPRCSTAWISPHETEGWGGAASGPVARGPEARSRSPSGQAPAPPLSLPPRGEARPRDLLWPPERGQPGHTSLPVEALRSCVRPREEPAAMSYRPPQPGSPRPGRDNLARACGVLPATAARSPDVATLLGSAAFFLSFIQ